MQPKLRPERLISEYPPVIRPNTWPRRIGRFVGESLGLAAFIAGAFAVAELIEPLRHALFALMSR